MKESSSSQQQKPIKSNLRNGKNNNNNENRYKKQPLNTKKEWNIEPRVREEKILSGWWNDDGEREKASKSKKGK